MNLLSSAAGPGRGPAGGPLAEAMALLDAARTERERLKALEQVRAATALLLRERADPDEEDLLLLERNIEQAEAAYRSATGSFESAIRALAGVREAIRQRLDVVKAAETVEVTPGVTFGDGQAQQSGPANRSRCRWRATSLMSPRASATPSASS